MRLYLMRHASAEEDGEPDNPSDPGLTQEGMIKARSAARGLASLGIQPDTLLTSPLRRAVQTAEIVARELEVRQDRLVRSETLQPEANPARFLEELSPIEENEVLCLGHSPQLDEVIALLLGCGAAVTALKKTAVACLELDSVEKSKGILIWLFPQRVLRRIAK
jgi:phosphohistidine phosphatase